MKYLKSIILGLFGGFLVIGLLPFIAIIMVLAGLTGQIKINEESNNENPNN